MQSNVNADRHPCASSHASPAAKRSLESDCDRRRFLQITSSVGAIPLVGAIGLEPAKAQEAAAKSKFKYCLNTITINGPQVDVLEQIRIAAEAGYDGVEFWLRDIDRYLKAGGQVAELRKAIVDSGLSVEGAIAFAQWIVDDQAKREAGLEQARKDMELVRELGGHRIAAPPAGATEGEILDLNRVAERYHALAEVGRSRDVAAQLEVWGFSKNVSTIGDVLFVTAASGHQDACILPDIYHIHKGGSSFNGLGMVPGARVHVFHMNDYPSEPKRDTLTDAHRVYPGDGVAPISLALQTLIRNGFHGTLSLELFNRDYWKQDPRVVAKTGLSKMKASVELAQV